MSKKMHTFNLTNKVKRKHKQAYCVQNVNPYRENIFCKLLKQIKFIVTLTGIIN
jgi:hypothetical protein